MAGKYQKDEDDSALFREALKDVRKLPRQNRVVLTSKRPRPRPRMREHDEDQVLVDMMTDPIEPENFHSGEVIQFARPGVQQRLMRKLRRGQFRVSAELDMHGMTVASARHLLAEFLQTCRNENRRCVRIIHGKGLGSRHRGPVLKQLVNHWLPQREEVLAFCSAPPRDGGTGAVYVLLKK